MNITIFLDNFHIRQSTSVSDFIECFSKIVHQLLVHEPTIASSVITNRFVDGLKEEIHSVIMVYRQQDLDTASSLAGPFAGGGLAGFRWERNKKT